jgi:hypothetical protein
MEKLSRKLPGVNVNGDGGCVDGGCRADRQSDDGKHYGETDRCT